MSTQNRNNQPEPDEESRIVHILPRNEGEQIHFTIRKYKGRLYFDVRLWYQPEDGGELVPTKKGISMAADLLPGLVEGLNILGQELSKPQPWDKKPERPAPKFPPKQAWAGRQS